jgi:hypothetical protein
MRISTAKESTGTWLKQIIEFLLNNKFGSLLESLFMKFTIKSWKNKTKQRKRTARGILMSMHAGKHFSKPDPENFQFKLLQLYEKNIAAVYEQYEHSSSLTNEIL